MSDCRNGRIDVHHHLVPPPFWRAMDKRGVDLVAGAPLPGWEPARSINVMDANGIGTALLSLSAPGVHFGDDQEARGLARECNEYAARVKQDHSGRFGFFAVLPMPLVDASCEEVLYALDHLGADGVVLLGSTQGLFLGDSRFEPLMAELDRREAVVFVHPNLHESSEKLGINTPGFLMEFLCDTSRAACNLIFNGVTERYPNIKWILAHAGGFLPYIAWRLSLGNLMPDLAAAAPQGVMTYIRRFYFDTALSPSPYVMACLKELVDPSHILFGSDFPFAPAPVAAIQTRTLDDSEVWTHEEKSAINRGNALRLFPDYALPGESAVPAPRYPALNFKGRVSKTLRSPMVALADRIRRR